MAITEFLLFVLTATLGGMFLCGPQVGNLLIHNHGQMHKYTPERVVGRRSIVDEI